MNKANVMLKYFSKTKKQITKSNIGLSIFLLAIISTISINELIAANNKNIIIDLQTTVVDGEIAPFNQLIPGDTLLINAGTRSSLMIKNVFGSSENPIIIINNKGLVIVNTVDYYGISIRNCSHFRLTGSGDIKHRYGIQVTRVEKGSGIGIGERSTDIEVDHISIQNTPIGGLYVKTDPNCTTPSTREKFTQYNTSIHDNYIARTGNEGMYIGSSNFTGETVKYNGNDTILMPPLLEGVKIFNNIIEYAGWDGIQVSSASKDCQIYGNTILYDSQAEYYAQMSGILIGGGTKGDCFNNFIAYGKGNGIESHGLGGYKIFNNIIVDAGKSYKPLDLNERKHGIFVTDVSVLPDSSFHIVHNDIINPKSDGIRFQSSISKNNLIASNLIINPGNFNLYEFGNTYLKGIDSYIMIPHDSADVRLENNFLTLDYGIAGLTDTYELLPESPLIDNASLSGVTFDYYNKSRPFGIKPDIGAVEYHDPQSTRNFESHRSVEIYPNPVKNQLTIRYKLLNTNSALIKVFNLAGDIVLQKNHLSDSKAIQEFQIDTVGLISGMYLFTIEKENELISGKFIKTE